MICVIFHTVPQKIFLDFPETFTPSDCSIESTSDTYFFLVFNSFFNSYPGGCHPTGEDGLVCNIFHK